MIEMTDTEVRYGPSLCPGCIQCKECQEHRRKTADYIQQLKKKIERLEKKLRLAAQECCPL
jgi:hypothetical protein